MLRVLVLAALLFRDGAQPQTLVVDLTATGHRDTVVLTQTLKQIEVTVTFGAPAMHAQIFQFPVDQGRQDAVCAVPVYLNREPLDYDLAKAIGSQVDGFVRSAHTYGFVVADKRCDSLHFFWNHKTHRVEWWRL